MSCCIVERLFSCGNEIMTWYVLLLFHYYHFSVAFILVLGVVQVIGTERRFIIIKVVVLVSVFSVLFSSLSTNTPNYSLVLIVSACMLVRRANFCKNFVHIVACKIINIT
jgi:hypothetical protein